MHLLYHFISGIYYIAMFVCSHITAQTMAVTTLY